MTHPSSVPPAKSKSKTSDSQQLLSQQLLLDQLQSLHSAGVLQIPKGRLSAASPLVAAKPAAVRPPDLAATGGSIAPQPTQPAKRIEPPPVAAVPLQTGESPRFTVPDQSAALRVLNSEVIACTKCPVLVQNRTQTVFGVGNPQSRVCFLGEAPGADEDRQGEPFVGRAGQLLTRMIEACTLRREDVYILNILKCRPPDNRTPTPDEVQNCRPFFQRQLEILRPEIICCLGAVAAQGLLETNVAVGKLRGKIHAYKWAKVVVTYHPAYLLRSPDQKRAAWEDLQLLMRELGLQVPEKKFG